MSNDRITTRDLEQLCRVINRTANGTIEEPWTRDESGNLRATIGVYVIDGAYGGWELHRISTPGGGVSDVFRCGHVSKRDLYNRMRAFIDGLEASAA